MILAPLRPLFFPFWEICSPLGPEISKMSDLQHLDNRLCGHFMEFRGFSLYISIIIATIVNFDPFWSLRFLVKMVKISIDHKKNS